MTPVYLRLSDLSDRAMRDVARIAAEWWSEGGVEGPWQRANPPAGWQTPDGLDVIPLHLGAGADLARIILATWPHPGRGTCEWRLATPTRLRTDLLAAAPKE